METQNPIHFLLPCLPIFFLIILPHLPHCPLHRLTNLEPQDPTRSLQLPNLPRPRHPRRPSLLLSTYAILSDPATGFAAPNTPFQNSVLDYSVAYFLTDLLHYLVFFPSDVLFIGHHLATLFVFLTCRYVASRGAFAILSLLILAEVTSLCQDVWTLADARRSDLKFAAKVYDLLSPPFYIFYSIVRGFVGPYFVYRMGAFYISGAADGLIPRWVWVSWIVVVVAAISVSILWISNLWVELFRARTGELEKKTG